MASPPRRSGLVALGLVLGGLGAFDARAQAQFVQSNVAFGSDTVRVGFSRPSTPGNTIIVALKSSVGPCPLSDNHGNSYTVAVGPSQGGTAGTTYTQIAYARNIIAGATPLEVTAACLGVEVFVFEYAGLDPVAPFDVGTAATSMTTTLLDSGPITTTFANDLLIGFAFSATSVLAPGPGFSTRLAFNGDQVEDRAVSSIGTYSATATANGPVWLMTIAAFKVAPAADAGSPFDAGPPHPYFVQSNAAEATKGPLSVPLPAPSRAGDTLVVALRSLSQTCGVTDSAGNTYSIAVPSTEGIGSLTTYFNQMLYARNIVAGPNPIEITATCTMAPEILVLEYAGLDPVNPFDVGTVAVSSSSVTLDSGFIVTSADNEVLVSWALCGGIVTSGGSGFGIRRRFNGDVLLDRVVSSAGSYAASATASNNTWVMELAAFKIAVDGATDGGAADGGAIDSGVIDSAVADAGGPSSRPYQVGCGCSQESQLPSLLLLALCAVSCRSTRRTSKSPHRPG